jgi:FKBP-type peptidyl-prolyl cis-trans isomerase (trigger factor)
MSEEVTPDQKMKITVEITGPKKAEDVKKMLAELEKAAKSQGFNVGKPWKEPK